MMSRFGQKAAVAAVAFAAVGSTLFGGVALAADRPTDKKHVVADDSKGKKHGDEWDIAGPGGKAGDAKAECFVPIAASVGLIAGKGGDITQCNAVGGDGGAGGSADDY